MSLRLNLSFSTTGASFPAIVAVVVGVRADASLLLFFPLLLFPTCLFVSQLYFYALFWLLLLLFLCPLPSITFPCLFFLFPAGASSPTAPCTSTTHRRLQSLGPSPTMRAAAPRSLALHILAFDSLSFHLLPGIPVPLFLFRSLYCPNWG